MSETTAVEYEVVGTEPVAGSGRLIGLANVRIEIAGVSLVLQGCQVVRVGDGSLACKAPTFRHPRTGTWLPAVMLPPELSAALAREVITAIGEQSS
jgi:hypothetical protein